jgi:amino acid permease
MHRAQSTAARLVLNGALLILAGYLCGAAIPHVPYPRIMLAAHSAGFMASGILSILAGLMIQTSLTSLPPRAARVAFFGHLTLWPLSFSEVAAAFWGTNKALAIAGAQAGATGGPPWQETLVIVMHAIPALALMVAWALLAWGTRQGGREPAAEVVTKLVIPGGAA